MNVTPLYKNKGKEKPGEKEGNKTEILIKKVTQTGMAGEIRRVGMKEVKNQ